MTLRKRLDTLVQKWAALLGIADYKFSLTMLADKDLAGDYARVDTDDSTREVSIDFNQYRLSKEPEEVEKTVVHELLHTRFNEYSEFVNDIIKLYVTSPKTRRLLKKQADKLEHKIIVAVAETLSKETK